MTGNNASGGRKVGADVARKYVAVASGAAFLLALAVNAVTLGSAELPASLPELELPLVRAVQLSPSYGAVLAWLAHACAGALVVLLVVRLSGSLYAGAGAGLVFAVHPVHIEAIAWSDARAVPVAGALALCACLLWFWDTRTGVSTQERARPGATRIAQMTLAVVMMAVAGYLMPTMAVMPACIWGAAAVRGRARGQGYRVRGTHWPILLVAVFMVFYGAVRGDLPRFDRSGELGGFAAWVDALGCMIVPWRLLPDYRPLYADAGIGSFAFGGILLTAIIVSARRLKRFPAFAGGFVWAFFSLIMSVSLDHVYRADWALYLASIGVVWTAGEALALLPLKGWIAAVVVAVAALAGRGIAYQGTFASPESVLEALESLPDEHHGAIARRYAMIGENRELKARVLQSEAARLDSESREDLADDYRRQAAALRLEAKRIASRARGAIARAEMALGRDAPVVLAARGEVEFRIGDYLKARAALEKAIAADMGKARTSRLLVLLGEIFARAGQVKEAEAKYHEAVEANERNAHAHYKLGTALLAQDKPDEAVDQFRRAAELKDDDAAFQNALGRVFERLLRFEDAATAYARACEIDPSNDGYRRDLETIRKIMQGRKNDPAAAKLAYQEGLALEAGGRLMEAAAAYQRAFAQVSGFHAAFYRAGLCKAAYGADLRKYEERRHYLSQAVEHFNAALALRPGYEPYLFALADAYRDLGQVMKSELVLMAILGRNPNSGKAHYRLARLYAYSLEDIPRARKQFKLAESLGVEPEPEFVENLDEIEAELNAPPQTEEEKKAERAAREASSEGEVLVSTGEYVEAAASFKRAYDALEGATRRGAIAARARAAWNAGGAWERAKKLPEAKAWYLNAARLQPSNGRYVADARRLSALVDSPAGGAGGEE